MSAQPGASEPSGREAAPELPSSFDPNAGPLRHWKRDILSGFLVFLIALPLSLGIAMASSFPPVAGVLTAMVGGLVVTWLGSARLTIKGPAAGLVVIALGAVVELGDGDISMGYRRALAVGVMAAVVQIVLAVARAGTLGSLMPPAVVHGMLAAIGVIIVSKQIHIAVGVNPHGKEPLHLLAEIPQSLAEANPEVALIGGVGLLLLIALGFAPFTWARKIPAPLVVLLIAVPLGLWFDFEHQHHYLFNGHDYEVGPTFLVNLPESLSSAIVFPDFSVAFSGPSLKYVVMFALVGSVESLLSVAAVDALDPEKRASDANKDLLATGVGNLVCAFIGGLPMISEIVRSKANIDNGAKTKLANFSHGAFLFLAVALIPGVIHEIPLAALAAMLVYTGLRLAAPAEFLHVYKIGREQLGLFVATLVVTLATDLLIGVAAGLALKVALHFMRGLSGRHLFKLQLSETTEGDTLHLGVKGAAVFTNFLPLMRRLKAPGEGIKKVVIDFEGTALVDHTVQERIDLISQEWSGCELEITGLHDHQCSSPHPMSARWRSAEEA